MSRNATYVIQPGDNYFQIAQSLERITPDTLIQANPQYPPNKLQPGDQITIPLQ
jgi:LysM repeat protein